MSPWWQRLLPSRPTKRARPGKVRIESEHGHSIEPFDDYEELRLRIAERTFWSGVPHSATVLDEPVEASTCHAGRDGDCEWTGCPQLRDGEPHKSGRHCPFDQPGGER